MRHSDPIAKVVSDAKCRAKKKGLDFDLTQDFIRSIDTDVCPYLGMPIQWGKGRGSAYDSSKSIDRIDSAKGYTEDNVIICSWRANSLLKNATADEMAILTINFHRILKEHTS